MGQKRESQDPKGGVGEEEVLGGAGCCQRGGELWGHVVRGIATSREGEEFGGEWYNAGGSGPQMRDGCLWQQDGGEGRVMM